MPAFRDANNRDWVLRLDAPAIKAVRSECQGLDLANLDGSAYDQIIDDPVLLIEALWILCREQGQRDGIIYEQFAKSLIGDVLDGATAALLEAITDFFPNRKRKLVKAVTDKSDKLRNLATQRAIDKINDPELEAEILAAIDEKIDDSLKIALTPSKRATGTPASSESAPSA